MTLEEIELNVEIDYLPIEMMDEKYYIEYMPHCEGPHLGEEDAAGAEVVSEDGEKQGHEDLPWRQPERGQHKDSHWKTELMRYIHRSKEQGRQTEEKSCNSKHHGPDPFLIHLKNRHWALQLFYSLRIYKKDYGC